MKTLFFITLACSAMLAQAQQQEVEQAIQKKYYDKYGKAGEDKLNAWMANAGNVELKEEYKFPLSVTQHVTNYEKGKVKSESDIKYFLNAEKKTFAMEGATDQSKKKKSSDKMINVFDQQASAMLMFNLSEKTVFAMNMNAFRSAASQEASKKPQEQPGKAPDMKCEKTSKTKTIMGYTCYEYTCRKSTDKEGTYTSMWVYSGGKIVDMPFGGVAGTAPGMYGKNIGISGAVMGMDSYKEGEMQTSMVVTEINEKADLTLVSKDFKRQDMPSANFSPQ